MIDREQDAYKYQVPHALEVNDIRLTLSMHHQLGRWIPESFIRVLNLSPATAYAKVYDGIAFVLVYGRSVEFAIEYERTLKSQAKYEKIREAIESEKRVKAFFYLVPTYELLYGITDALWRMKQLVLFALVDEFKKDRLDTRVRDSWYRGSRLQDALARMLPASDAQRGF